MEVLISVYGLPDTYLTKFTNFYPFNVKSQEIMVLCSVALWLSLNNYLKYFV